MYTKISQKEIMECRRVIVGGVDNMDNLKWGLLEVGYMAGLYGFYGRVYLFNSMKYGEIVFIENSRADKIGNKKTCVSQEQISICNKKAGVIMNEYYKDTVQRNVNLWALIENLVDVAIQAYNEQEEEKGA